MNALTAPLPVQLPVSDLTAFIVRDGAELITDSRAVAIAFGRRHADVLKTIERMLLSSVAEIQGHAQRNFSLCSYDDGRGRTRPMYRMTAEGLSELAMGFTGDPSRVVRIRFLAAFKEVAIRLQGAERSITEKLFELERREMPSKVKGQIGSRLMNERRKEKPDLEAERAALESLSQPRLIADPEIKH